jgi:hypothetical protein
METIIFALISMVAILLVISFLPLGMTLKGKFISVGIAFVLALSGLAAVSTMPVWATLLLLLVLSFFASYMMNSRMGNVLYSIGLKADEENSGDRESYFINDPMQQSDDELDFLDLAQLEAAPSLQPREENFDIEDSRLNNEPSISLNKVNHEVEITILQEMPVDLENIDTLDEHETVDLKQDYLSDIENLILEEGISNSEKEDADWLSELEELPLEKDNEDEHFLEELFLDSQADKEDKKKEKKLELLK